jgi:hypothetical protein
LIRAEKRSGTTTEGREELRTVLDFLRKGESATCKIAVKARGASLKAAEQLIDTGTAAGKCFLDRARRVRRVRNQLAPRAPA